MQTRFPKHSPDLNAIENARAFLRSRLDDTRPACVEGRDAFLPRLRRAVAWINREHRRALLKLSYNQAERARDVLAAKGVRTQW